MSKQISTDYVNEAFTKINCWIFIQHFPRQQIPLSYSKLSNALSIQQKVSLEIILVKDFDILGFDIIVWAVHQQS